LITGATSAIAGEVAKLYAKQGAAFYLVARNEERLNNVVQDLRSLGASDVAAAVVDLDDTAKHHDLVRRAVERLGGVDIVLIAQGVLGSQTQGELDFQDAGAVLKTNFVSVVSLLTELTCKPILERGSSLVVIGSVAGDRGRRSNYIYGASKAGLEAYVEGLRARLFAQGIAVTLIKPGFVETPMTAHMEKRPLAASAPAVAAGIVRAIGGRKDVAYVPWIWRPIMQAVRALPQVIFKRLNF
jgi:decaprenylphospho-beta-D-erythro-pentofuranosid-2-ulose 2-reductase